MRPAGWLALTFAALSLISSGCQSFRERAAKTESLESLVEKDPPVAAVVEAVIKTGLERCVTVRPAFMTIGTGALVSSEGWILTAEHVVRGRPSVKIDLADGRSFDARVVATSAGNDFALLKIEASGLKYYKIGNRPGLGDRVVAIGTPAKWVNPNASTGLVIYPQVRIPGEHGTYYYDAIFHSAPIFPGDSGGPLLDLKGDLIGIHGGFASSSASVAPACIEIMRVLPGAGRKRLSMDDFQTAAVELPVVWPARMPRNFAESSEWTIRSVDETLVEVYRETIPDREVVHDILAKTRREFLARRANDRRSDDDLVRAMLSEVFNKLQAASKRGPSPRRGRRARLRLAA